MTPRRYLAPGEKCLFTWDRPSGSRSLSWTVSGIQGKHFENSLRTDECDVFRVGNGQFARVSFLDGMQRVLLFTGQVRTCMLERLYDVHLKTVHLKTVHL